MFEILEHTADIGIRAWGPTPEQMMESAALALVSIAAEVDAVEERQVYPIAAAGDDPETLLVNWLAEVLYYVDGKRVLMRRFRIGQLQAGSVVGQGWGEPWDPRRHRPRLVVKGVTYHQLSIVREAERVVAEVFLDI